MASEKKNQKTKDPEQQRQRKEEKSRAARRRNRQIIGFALSILIIVGAVSIVNGVFNLVGNLIDSADERAVYQTRFEPMVWFDILPFDSIAAVDENEIKQVCIWGVLTKLGDSIDRNEKGEPIVPADEVDLYGMELFGPDFRFTVHESFVNTLFDLRYIYDESTNSYAAPNTGLMPPYLASVVEIKRESGGVRRVVMGYISTRTADDQVIAVPDYDNPAKYLDYMLRRDGKDYYLYAIQQNTTYIPTESTGAAIGEGEEIPPVIEVIDPDELPAPQENASSEQDSSLNTGDDESAPDEEDSSTGTDSSANEDSSTNEDGEDSSV